MQRKQRIRLCCAAALALAAGCTTDSGGSMIIVQNQVPDDGCIIPSSQSATFRGRGIIDVQAGEGYVFTPLLQSLVLENTTSDSPRVVAVRGADVDLSFPDGFFSAEEETELQGSRLTRFSTAFSGSVFPGAFTSFGFVIVPRGLLERLDVELGSGEQVAVTAEVTVFGELDGDDVDSVPFIYPVDVCDGCMRIDNGDCTSLGDNFEPLEGGECNLLQDVQVDCCTVGGAVRCPVPT